ncbi:MAG: ubiquinol-cytochrome C chaperone [Beijerinckiaceae bacterium]|nr:ubiquinol-cytochrome C chaperone [Beijerinckiaceae bacterium]
MFGLFKKDPRRDIVLALYKRVADASRAPWLYLDAGVPDSVEGRLESLTVHALLVMRRLKALPEPAPDAAQEFIDVLFQHVDHGLRELGVGDVVVPKRMKKIAQNFYGRVNAYAEPLDQGDRAALAAALERNIPGVASARLVPYLAASESLLSGLSLDEILNATTLFAPPQGDLPASGEPA